MLFCRNCGKFMKFTRISLRARLKKAANIYCGYCGRIVISADTKEPEYLTRLRVNEK